MARDKELSSCRVKELGQPNCGTEEPSLRLVDRRHIETASLCCCGKQHSTHQSSQHSTTNRIKSDNLFGDVIPPNNPIDPHRAEKRKRESKAKGGFSDWLREISAKTSRLVPRGRRAPGGHDGPSPKPKTTRNPAGGRHDSSCRIVSSSAAYRRHCS